MKKLSNTETKLKKSAAYEKKRVLMQHGEKPLNCPKNILKIMTLKIAYVKECIDKTNGTLKL